AAIWVLAISALAQKTGPSVGMLNSFTSSDGSFRITYPQMLIRCELQPNADAYMWAQSACSSYIPVCGDKPIPGQPIICIAYPHNEHTNTPTFEAATLSIDETDDSEKACLSGERKIADATIGGIRFRGFSTMDGAMNQNRYVRSYTTFHNGKCYGLA